tara:strand:- start:1865 stop:3130 length:1266 start_codon:yes stop_codon:yes gene_type:complete
MPVNPSNKRLRKAKNLNNYGVPYGGFGFGLPSKIGNRFRMFNLYQKKCHIYEDIYKEWKWKLLDTITNAQGDNFGKFFVSSYNANVIVIIAPDFEKNINANQVKVGKIFFYEFNDNTATYNITHSIEGDYNTRYTNPAMRRLDISNDGSTVIITSTHFTNNAGTLPARCRIFKKNNNNWIQHSEIVAPKIDSLYCCISGNGNRIALSNGGNIVNGNNDGLVHIYRPDNATWIQHGTTIDDGAITTGFGTSMSFNGDGSTIVIGSSKVNGYVKIYNFTNDWTLHTTINSTSLDFGLSVDIDDNTEWIVISDHNNSRCVIYKYGPSSKTWDEHETIHIPGQLTKNNVSISNDKKIILSDHTNNNGYFIIYKLDSSNKWIIDKSYTYGTVAGQELGKFSLINARGNTAIVSDSNENIQFYKFGL